MTFYKMTDDYNQEFIIDYNGTKLPISLRYVPVGKRWYAGVTDIVDGVKVVLGVPIFDQYGFGDMFFVKLSEEREVFKEIAGTYLVVASPEETEFILNPIASQSSMGVQVV